MIQSAVQPLKRYSLTIQVVAGIRNAILTGEYHFGQRLLESDLARQFDVSHNVIREAFHVLQGEGIIVTDSSRSRSVITMDESKAKEISVLRTSLESVAASWAAERLSDSWRERILQEARKIKHSSVNNYAEWIDVEVSFHRTIWQAAQSDSLLQQLNQLIVPMFALKTVRYFRADVSLEEILKVRTEWEETNHHCGHQPLAKAILNGNPEEARKCMILHLMGAPYFERLRMQFFNV